jgi:hypothetical protein
MPIRIVDKTFTDIFSNNTTFYKSNAGDKITLSIDIEASIQVTHSASSNIQINRIDDEFYLYGTTGWLDAGFRLGDSITWDLYAISDGTLFSTNAETITYIDNTTLRVSGDITAFDDTLYIVRISTTRAHADLELNFNHILNSDNPLTPSLIDGETTVIKFTDIAGLSVSSSLSGDLVGKQSGQYLISGDITRNADAYGSRTYTVDLVFINSGVYDSEWFDSDECLKTSIKYKFYSLPNESSYVTVISEAPSSDTGWFGEAFNTGVIDSTLVSSIDAIDYSQPTTDSFKVDTSATELYLGAQYVSIDEDYYKNKVSNQNTLGLLLDAYVPLAVGTYTSQGGLYTIDVNYINLVGTEYEVNITFTPLTGFETLFDSFEDGDRLFYIWCKAGNVNHLVFNNQLTKSISTTGTLQNKILTILRQNNNVYSIGANQTVSKTNTEDDLAIFSEFTIQPNTIYDGCRVKIQSRNVSTGDKFTLQEMFFDFGGLSINSSGQYNLNISQGVSNNLPSTSTKKTAKLERLTGSNTARLHYPFINDWRYWIAEVNANANFYPNQNKKWLNYITGDWIIEAVVSLENDVSYEASITLPIKDYDTEPTLTSEIKLFRPDNSEVGAFIIGEVMRIDAIHTMSVNTINTYWGQITIEDYEGNPRWTMSTVYDTDYNASNPLQPTTGSTKLDGALSSGDTVLTLTCYIDTNKLPKDSYKVTSKAFINTVEEPPTGFEFQNSEAVQSQELQYLTPQQ